MKANTIAAVCFLLAIASGILADDLWQHYKLEASCPDNMEGEKLVSTVVSLVDRSVTCTYVRTNAGVPKSRSGKLAKVRSDR